jgi:hypothetical protein
MKSNLILFALFFLCSCACHEKTSSETETEPRVMEHRFDTGSFDAR